MILPVDTFLKFFKKGYEPYDNGIDYMENKRLKSLDELDDLWNKLMETNDELSE